MKLTIAIPTYNRGEILVATVTRLLALEPRADHILIADQTREHPPAVQQQLEAWSRSGEIEWLRLPEPSIPHAMNEALLAARTDLVLFLDDDIEPSPALVREHVRGHAEPDVLAVAGQVLQPGQTPEHFDLSSDELEFHFNHDEACDVPNMMAGNVSVKRDAAIAAGGFDENYIGAAYRFETDFALRLCASGGRIRYEPRASIRHLKLSSGGLRSLGDHRSSASPAHTVGDYYFALCHRRGSFWKYSAERIVANVATRYHLTHPWAIPTKLIGELRGIALARKLASDRPRLIGNSRTDAQIQRNG